MDDTTEIKTLLQGIADLLPTLATKDDIARLEGRVVRLEAGQDELRGDVNDLRRGLEDLRHIVASNHFKVIGRIDQVASMLADHMADPHGPHHPYTKPAAE